MSSSRGFVPFQCRGFRLDESVNSDSDSFCQGQQTDLPVGGSAVIAVIDSEDESQAHSSAERRRIEMEAKDYSVHEFRQSMGQHEGNLASMLQVVETWHAKLPDNKYVESLLPQIKVFAAELTAFRDRMVALQESGEAGRLVEFRDDIVSEIEQQSINMETKFKSMQQDVDSLLPRASDETRRLKRGGSEASIEGEVKRSCTAFGSNEYE